MHILIPLDDFKAVLSIDDREDKLSRFCLITATYAIEHYCMRRLLRKKHFEHIEFTGDLLLPLKEYPVRKIISVSSEQIAVSNEEQLLPEFYRSVPDLGCDEDLPFSLALQIPKRYLGGKVVFRVHYTAGYDIGKVPPDLASACLELAAWNMNRYRGRRIGMTGNVRGGGKDGEHFESSMPMQVRQLLEPYKRRVI